MNYKRTTIALLTGFLIGFFIVHPVTGIIRELLDFRNGRLHIEWYEITDALATAYSLYHVPNAIVYGILTAIVIYLWARSNSIYRQIAEQAQLFALIGQETSTIVHDIKNPLFGIQGFAELICEGLEDTEKKEYCISLKKSAKRISGLLAEIKTLATQQGRLLLQKQSIWLDELTRTASEESFIRIKIIIDKSMHQLVPLDPLYFQRVLWNIIKNADEAIRNRNDGFISFSLSCTDAKFVLTIADNGPGIPHQIKRKLFTIGVTYGKKHGSGLGLFAAKRIVEAHSGTISAQDREGGGTVFTIQISRK